MKLVAENLVVARGERTIVDGVSFTVSAGEALLLTGPNGAGKTTLLRSIAGFLPPKSGTIRLDGAAADRDFSEHCHYVGHLNGVKANLTVAETLTFWGTYLTPIEPDPGMSRNRLLKALGRFGLAALADIPAAYLSAGQKRRVGLARLAVAYRPIWLLDEPTSSLDAASTGVMAEAARAHMASGGLVLAATHLPLGLAGARELRLGGEGSP